MHGTLWAMGVCLRLGQLDTKLGYPLIDRFRVHYDRAFSKWMPWKFHFGYTVSITTFYVGLWYKMYMLCIYQYISVLMQK